MEILQAEEPLDHFLTLETFRSKDPNSGEAMDPETISVWWPIGEEIQYSTNLPDP